MVKDNLTIDYKSKIKDSLVKNNIPEKTADEIAFNLAEIIPDFDGLSLKISEDSLEYNDILKIYIHVPYHVEELVRLMKSKSVD